MPGASTALPGSFSRLNDANGHPLYTYSGDSAPGQANGQGIGNIWFVVPTTLQAATSTPSGNTMPTPGGYRYP